MQLRVEPSDSRRHRLAGREIGEIEIRGPSMMSGYLGADPIDPETWFPTGDLGYLTDGGLVVCGRVKELITVAGRNVFPTEVERVAAQVRGVREGAVVAVGADEASARPGLVITAEFRGPDEAGARSELVQRIASECGVVPADVVFVCAGNAAADVVGQAAATRGQTKSGGGAVVTASVALDVAGYRALLDEVFDEQVVAWTAEAEATERFPRKLIEYLGASGVFTGKWGGQQQPDVAKAASSSPTSWAISARPASASASACTTRRSRSCAGSASPTTSRPSRTQAIRGEAVLCIGASEESGGSDLQIVRDRSASGTRRFRGPRDQEVRLAVPHRRPHHGGGTQCRPRPEQPARQRPGDRRPDGPGRRADALPQGGRGTAGHRRRAHRHMGACRRVGRAGGYRPGRHLMGPGP